MTILMTFQMQDIKGSCDLRNFIAHDIVEDVIKERLLIIKKSTQKIFSEE